MRPSLHATIASRMRLPAALFVFLAVGLGGPKIPPVRPDVQGVVPHGAQRGTDVEVTIRGRNFQNATEILFASGNIRTTMLHVEHSEIKARFEVGANAEPGRHDFRIIAPHGSTISWFDISDRPEAFEQEPNNDREQAQTVELPALINGVARAADYDYFRFVVRAGQTVTFDVRAARTGSALDPVIGLLDAQGREIGYSDDYYMFKDAHLVHTFDEGGVYFVRIYGSAETGSENADYRLIVGEMPHVDHAMPSGGTRGETVEFDLVGVNLESVRSVVLGDGIAAGEVLTTSSRSVRVRLSIPENARPRVHRLHVGDATLPVPFVVSDLPEITVGGDMARNKRDPVPVTLPVVVNGVLGEPRAADYVSFRVDGPRKVVLQVDSMQLGFLLDPMVAIYDESGKRLVYQDEPTTNTGKEPSNLDPHLVFELPHAGRYIAMVRDSQYRGDPTMAYRFTIKKAEPDFTLTVIGTDETLFRGRENIVTVRVRRLEGWDAPVEVWAENLPEGVTASKAVAQPKNTAYLGTCGEEHFLDGTNVGIPIFVEPNAPQGRGWIRFRGRGAINGRTVDHVAHTRYWWKTLRKVRGLSETRDLLTTIADAPLLVFETPESLSLAPGQSDRIKVVVTRLDQGSGPIEISAESTTGGVTVEPVTIAANATLAQMPITRKGDREGRVVLVASSEGKVLGKSHPIAIETPKESKIEVAANED